MEEKGSHSSSVLNKFDLKDAQEAKCKQCNQTLNYKSVKCLENHLKSHDAIEEDSDEVEETGYTDKEPESEEDKNLWMYFTINNPIKKTATCNICNVKFSFADMDILARHLLKRHASADDDTLEQVESDDETDKTARYRSLAWKYFKRLEDPSKSAKCKFCGMTLSYKTSVSNLLKHVRRKHPYSMAKSEPGDDYEIQSKPLNPAWRYFNVIDTEVKLSECQICQTQLSYAESTRQMTRHLRTKHPHLNLKNDSQDPLEEIYLDDFENLIKEIKTPNKKRKVTNNSLFNTDNNSSDEEVTVISNVKNNDSLDLFGKYIVSLLRQLPRVKAIQLQSDFVKQIMAAQIECENEITNVSVMEDVDK